MQFYLSFISYEGIVYIFMRLSIRKTAKVWNAIFSPKKFEMLFAKPGQHYEQLRYDMQCHKHHVDRQFDTRKY